ncbi:hypothetical protein LIER_14153 [Lithospermum erythrorhizon]|uniref:Uncharacterized protein n=1 Tax=Lithospermum erythrorhizon TaxID=34254 RepID=A0AAV3Q014_LITER
MRRDTIEVLLCGGDWIKESYGIRTPKLGNDDPIELEFENEYQMEDPKSNTIVVAAAPTASNEPEQAQVDSIEKLPVTPQTSKQPV